MVSTLLKTVKILNNKESLTNCHSQEETKELKWLNVMFLGGTMEQKGEIRGKKKLRKWK